MNGSTEWRLDTGQEDRLRLQVAALRADAFDRFKIAWEGASFRELVGPNLHAGDLGERTRMPDGRTAWHGTADVTVQAALRGTWEISGALVPRGGGGAITCATAIVTVR